MKVAIALCALGFLAMATALPTKPEIVEKVKAIRDLVRTTLDDIEAVAIADNAEVGAKIKEKLEAKAKKARGLLKEAREIDVPTKEKVKEMVTHFLAVLDDVKNEVKDEVKLLSPEAQANISGKFKTSLEKAKEMFKSAIPEESVAE